MFIAIDIGNTHTVIGAYEEETFKADLRIPSTIQRTDDEIRAQALTMFTKKGIDTEKIDGVGISSVVPHLTDIYVSLSKKFLHQEPLIVNANVDLGITIHYDNPKSVGADRLQNMADHSSLLISEQQPHTTLWLQTAIILVVSLLPALKHLLQIYTNERQDCQRSTCIFQIVLSVLIL